jgi:kynurenine formamidase
MSREIIDLSVPIAEGMATWPGDVEVRLWRQKTLADGFANVGGIQLGTHAGTHLDAPFHWFEGGAKVDETPLERLVGPARVIDLRGRAPTISAAELSAACGDVSAGERLLLLTGWRGEVTDRDYPHLSGEAAEWLVERELALVGVDTPSVDGPAAGQAHEALLGASVPVIELLVNLDRLVGREFELIALPLAVVGTDGAPVRAVGVLGEDVASDG